MDREGESLHLRTRRETDTCGVEFQLHPLPGSRKIARGETLAGARLAPLNDVFPPDRAVGPGTCVELDHHFLRGIFRVVVDVQEELSADRHDEFLGTLFVIDLCHTPSLDLHRFRAACDRLRDEFLRGYRSPDLRALWEGIFKPDVLGFGDWRLRILLGRVLVLDRRCQVLDLFLHCGLTFRERRHLGVMAGRLHFDHGLGQKRVAVQGRIGIRIEEGVERVEVLSRNRIVFVIMTDRALRSQP